MRSNNLIIFLSTLLLLSSCSVKRFIPEDKSLYNGASIKIETAEKISDLGVVKDDLNQVLKPEPNSKILGARLGLLFHYKAQRENPGFINKFLNKKFGEEPVYYSDVDVEKTENLLKNRLENHGFYYSVTRTEKDEKKKTIHYKIKLTKPYKIYSYELTSDTLPIYKDLEESLNRSNLKKGDRYNLNELKEERIRIDKALKNKGYYNFNPDFLIFEIDTNRHKARQFDLYLRLKKDIPRQALIPFKIKKVDVYPNYSIDTESTASDTVTLNGVHFIQDTVFFLPKRLAPFILFKPGQQYDPKVAKRTSNRLTSIGSYKFVNIQFEEGTVKETDSLGFLDASVYLSPMNKRAIKFELQGVTKSNSFTGPTFTVTHTNRNLFKGGEIVNISGKAGYEQQFFNESNAGLSSTQFGIGGDLLFPRLLSPIHFDEYFTYSIPKTKLSAGIETLSRSKLYRLSSFAGSFGYIWRSSKYVFHEIDPLSINYVKLSNTSEEFEKILDENLFLRSSFEQELIAGLTYNFTYSQLVDATVVNPIFFTSNFEMAGNALSLLQTSSNNENGKGTFLGVEYAQFVKLDVDFRYHLRVGKMQSIVSRAFAGYGIAYGNSDALPFSKQYFSGGPYSIRAFRIRSIGPGAFVPEDNNASFFDQSGDIRLEGNIEYRFPVYSYLKGAVFADAGNVWLREENEALPGGKFTSSFTKQLAVGLGVGLRFDIQSFVIRFDFATPVKKPYMENNENDPVETGQVILNFALGYPF